MNEIVTEKKCTSCKEVKPVSEFCVNKAKKDGINTICRQCQRIKKNSWDAENAERIKEYTKEYYRNDPERSKAAAVKWQKEHPERMKEINRKTKEKHKVSIQEYFKRRYEEAKEAFKAYSRKRYAEHKDKHISYKQRNAEAIREKKREYNQKNQEKNRVSHREWFRKNPEKAQIYERNREARKIGGHVSIEEWREIKNKYGNKCLCCGRSDVKLTMDHVVPLVVGGKHQADNIQPLCLPCNSSKGKKVIDYR